MEQNISKENFLNAINLISDFCFCSECENCPCFFCKKCILTEPPMMWNTRFIERSFKEENNVNA